MAGGAEGVLSRASVASVVANGSSSLHEVSTRGAEVMSHRADTKRAKWVPNVSERLNFTPPSDCLYYLLSYYNFS